MSYYTVEQQDAIGIKIAEVLGLKKVGNRYPTEWGDKSNIGLFNMILVMADKIHTKKFEF